MSKQVKVKVVFSGPRTVTVDGVTIVSEVLCSFTAGKVYDATLYAEGEMLDIGFPALADTLVFAADDYGVRADTIYQGTELEIVED